VTALSAAAVEPVVPVHVTDAAVNVAVGVVIVLLVSVLVLEIVGTATPLDVMAPWTSNRLGMMRGASMWLAP
jgi:hypothetical protein